MNRDTLWHEHFTTDSTLLSWRNSFRPDTAQKVDYTLADITHDSTQGGRLKVALVANPLADDGAMIAAVGIDHEGLQIGKRYLLSFRADTMHLPENYRKLKIGYFTDSMLAVGLPFPEYLEDIIYSGDTIKTEFIAAGIHLRMVLIAESPEAGSEGFYYLDDYTLREGWVTHLSCDPGNVANNADAKRYRYGFNGQERDYEINGEGNINTAEFWEYDARLGRRWNRDPITYPWQSSYATFNNDPIIYIDPLGLYGTKKRAEKMRQKAIDAGFKVSDVYQTEKQQRSDGTWTKGGKYGFVYSSDNWENATHVFKGNKFSKTSDNRAESHFLYGAVINFPHIYDDTNWGKEDKSKYSPYLPDGVAFTVGGNFVPGLGATKSFTLVMTTTGAQLYGNVGASVGNDVSVGFGFSFLDFERLDKWREDYTGGYSDVEGGVLGLTVSRTTSYDLETKQATNLVNAMGIGFSLGSKQLPMGAISIRKGIGFTYKINMPWQE